MSENLFKDSQCPIAPVPKADFEFISAVCEIAPLPPPIYGCQAPIIPREPPTDVGIKCPDFSAITTLGVNFVDTSGGGTCDEAKNELKIARTDIDPCKYEVTLDLNIPVPRIPCSTLTAGAFGLEVGYQDCVTQTSEIRITSIITPGDCTTPDSCEFVIDLDLKIPVPKPPCPQIVITNFAVNSGYADSSCMTGTQNKFTLTPVITAGDCDTADDCRFEIDLEIAIPIPRPPCPLINLTNFTVDSGYSDGDCLLDKQNYFNITSREIPGDCNTPASCEFDIDLQIAIPIPRTPCPTLNPPTLKVTSGYDDSSCITGQNRFEITTRVIPGDCNNADQCEFDFDLEIIIPIPRPPCPIINSPTLTVKTSYEDQNCLLPESKFTITTSHTPGDCDTSDQCEFDIELEISIPIPRPPCPIINSPALTVKTSYKDQNCPLPESKFTITTSHTPGDCDTPDQCEFDIELEINIPIPRPPCPIINSPTLKITTGYADQPCAQGSSKFEITTSHTPGTCDEPDQCEFNVDLEIVIPIPRTPCPILNSPTLKLSVGYDDPTCSQSGDSSFTITTRQIPGDCNTPDQCEFDFDLTLSIPIPKPPCPNINVNSFEVTSGYADSTCVQSKSNKFEITSTITPGDCNTPDQCDFNIDLEIVVPIPPPPCIQLTTKSFTQKVGYTGTACVSGSSKFEIVTEVTPAAGCDQPETCDFNIYLDLVIPIPRPKCPTLLQFMTVNSHYQDGPSGRLSNTPSFFNLITATTPATCTDPGNCTYLFDIHIDVPTPRPPCTAIRVKNATHQADYNISPNFKFEINKCAEYDEKAGTNDPPVCCYEIDFELDIKLPEPPCTTVSLDVYLEVLGPDETPYVYAPSPISSFDPGKSCDVVLPLSLGIPQPCKTIITGGECEWTHAVGCDEKPRAEIMVEELGPCEFKITPYIWFPVCTPPPCPNIQLKVNFNPDVTTPYADSPSVTPTGGTDGEPCVYELQLNLGIPKLPECVQITAGTGIATLGSCDSKATISLDIANTGTSTACAYTITPNVTIPVCKITGGTVTLLPSGVGNGTITVEDDQLNISISLNTTDCPAGGSSGVSGLSGSCEIGATGATGVKGDTGATGATGVKGDTGATGATGATGVQGATGATGVKGTTGPTGVMGPTGVQGVIGVKGATGSTGVHGATGATGVYGATGATGATGVQGFIGPEGETGPTGCTGDKGDTGPQGPAGAKGDTGNIGPAGAKGQKGDKGDNGVAGPIGLRGVTGPIGLIGDTGATGVYGATGVTGATGPTGVAGPTGETGATGTTFRIIDEPAPARRKRPAGEPDGEFENVFFRDVFNVKDYGATGDGATDDSIAIDNAIQAARVGNGCVYFPRGQYQIETMLNVNVASAITLLGDGDGSVLRMCSENGLLSVTMSTGDTIQIRHLRIVAMSPVCTTAIKIQNTTGQNNPTNNKHNVNMLQMFGVTMQRGSIHFLKALELRYVYNAEITNCVFANGTTDAPREQDIGIDIIDMSENLHVTACTFTGWMYGIKYVRLAEDKYQDGIHITNTFFGDVFYGMWLAVPSDLKSIAGLHITNTEIHASGPGSACLNLKNVADIHISNSYFSVAQNNGDDLCRAARGTWQFCEKPPSTLCVGVIAAPDEACIHARQVAGMQIVGSRFQINNGFGIALVDSDVPVRTYDEEITCQNYFIVDSIVANSCPTDCLENTLGCLGVTITSSTFTGNAMIGAIYIEPNTVGCVVRNNVRFEHCNEPGREVKMQAIALGNINLAPVDNNDIQDQIGSGAAGTNGATGPQGITGITGSVGATGAAGVTGPQGPVGITGQRGVQGATGVTGFTGPQGPVGITGQRGVQGATGVKGATGAIGVVGASGVIGSQGATGVAGATGPEGATGPCGNVGATGAVGPRGATGIIPTGGTITFIPSAVGSGTITANTSSINGNINLNIAELVRSGAFLNEFIAQLNTNTNLRNALRAVLNN